VSVTEQLLLAQSLALTVATSLQTVDEAVQRPIPLLLTKVGSSGIPVPLTPDMAAGKVL
jgi:hypothetical protein